MSRLIEVWGDTVDSRHMTWSIALGVGLAAPTFLIADRLFKASVDDKGLAHSYALLTGLVACLLAGLISGLLFKPKRVVNEKTISQASMRAALDETEAESGPLGDPSELDAAVQQELRSLGLYDVLASEHTRRTTEPKEATR